MLGSLAIRKPSITGGRQAALEARDAAAAAAGDERLARRTRAVVHAPLLATLYYVMVYHADAPETAPHAPVVLRQVGGLAGRCFPRRRA